MPEQWGMSEKITACDLGNGHFLFNFDNEEDLNCVLNQGPFHHNFSMFVLVRWEPVIDEHYPSMVLFWIHLQGIPLHLCTHQNLESIGNRLGKVDTIDAAKGKINVEMESSKPLKFSRKLQTINKEDITIKLHYEKVFKHCTTCGLMSHEAQDCLTKVTTGNARVIDETSYRPYKEGASSYSRVQQSSHSSRVNRATNPRDSRYNPYSYVRKQDIAGRHQDASSAGEALKLRSAITGSIEPKSRTATEQPLIDSNVTFRSNSSTRTLVSDVEARAEDLIPPYNALKIAAMNEYDNDNEEGDAADADMEEPIGNELMIMEEDDLLGEDLVTFKSPDMEANIQNILESSILMIEANQNADKDEADEDAAEKTVTRSITRSLFPTSQLGNQRRASPQINAKTTQESSRTLEKRKGLKC
ncbi:hypothetical protein DY000_02059969 [Brassica cretica]|uniref:DUF4283 domain-containing protein n=1 Tax=Brassica cretica TaxID=69181 RepID=A0ABQ7AND3_BRACR|nr:hypothetical protein DY000_02059969 [Brassica cretica]